MTTTERRVRAPAAAPVYRAVDRPEDLTHVVCCRDYTWARGLCGADTGGYLDLGATNTCAMCIEIMRDAFAKLPADRPADTCPIDGCPCPPDAELDEIIRRRLAG
jgi:hypothetical protein